MFIRGTSVQAELQFMRVQPYVTPKIQLTDQHTERVEEFAAQTNLFAAADESALSDVEEEWAKSVLVHLSMAASA